MNEEQNVIKIKSITKKKSALRKKHDSDNEDEESEVNSLQEKLLEMREIQRLRERPNGVSVLTLALGEKMSKIEEALLTDPFNIKDGGLVNMAAMKDGLADDAYNADIGTQFSAETNKRDEDDEMMKYIEVELSKRKGQKKDDSEVQKYLSPEEAALMAIPDHLRNSSSQRNEEMLSNQMLSGIPEVDLGIEAKIRNIEATEEAKLKLLWDSRNQKDTPSQFVPTNMAVNFVQHNRFTMDDSRKNAGKSGDTEKSPARAELPHGTKRPKSSNDKATDDYHFEKFKKQYRKYV